MVWIETVADAQADGALREVYDEIKATRGKIAEIMQVQSLNPDAIRAHLDLYLQLMFRRSGLSRAERETIAVAVSAANGCAYCINHHREALSHHLHDEPLLERLSKEPEKAPLPGRSGAIVAYAVKLTRTPFAADEKDVDRLKAAGLSDAEVLDVNLITAYFNFVNRIALGLGVGFSDEEVSGYREV